MVISYDDERFQADKETVQKLENLREELIRKAKRAIDGSMISPKIDDKMILIEAKNGKPSGPDYEALCLTISIIRARIRLYLKYSCEPFSFISI